MIEHVAIFYCYLRHHSELVVEKADDSPLPTWPPGPSRAPPWCRGAATAPTAAIAGPQPFTSSFPWDRCCGSGKAFQPGKIFHRLHRELAADRAKHFLFHLSVNTELREFNKIISSLI